MCSDPSVQWAISLLKNKKKDKTLVKHFVAHCIIGSYQQSSYNVEQSSGMSLNFTYHQRELSLFLQCLAFRVVYFIDVLSVVIIQFGPVRLPEPSE